ncbi:hypothetical protein EDB84DRAFT_1544637 [Lactarius hengduanensis]|nr:hypothetical protein EDB84DRAFT_1544637 [Lactarius hengduanensis]
MRSIDGSSLRLWILVVLLVVVSETTMARCHHHFLSQIVFTVGGLLSSWTARVVSKISK